MNLLKAEDGQDMVEYSLLMAAITLACAALMFGVGGNVGTLWSIVNSRLSDAASGS